MVQSEIAILRNEPYSRALRPLLWPARHQAAPQKDAGSASWLMRLSARARGGGRQHRAHRRDGKLQEHATAVMFVTDPDFTFAVEERPRYVQVRAGMVARDWAIITLADRLSVKPILWRIIWKADLLKAVEPGEGTSAGDARERLIPACH